jgi:hypothetical protein
MKKLFKNLDILSQSPQFYIEKEKIHKHVIGGMVSLFMIIFIIFMSILLLLDSYGRKLIKFSYLVEKNVKETKINLTEMPFFFSFVYLNNSVISNMDRFWNVSLQYREYNNFGLISEKDIFFKPCSQDLIGSTTFPIKQFSEAFCPTYPSSILLQQNKDENSFSKLTIRVSMCRDSFCNSDEEVKYVSNNSMFLIKYFDYSFDRYTSRNLIPNLKSLYFPLKKFSESHSYTLDSKTVLHEKDEGLLYESIGKFQYFQLNKFTKEEKSLSNTGADEYVQINIISSNHKEIYVTKTPKIHNIIAKIGGIMYFTFYVAVIVAKFLTQNVYFIYLADSTGFFNSPFDSNFNDSKKKTEDINNSTQQFINNEFIKIKIIPQFKKKQTHSILKNTKKEIQKTIKINWKEFIFPFFCFHKKTKAYFNKLIIERYKKYSYQQLDVSNFIKNMKKFKLIEEFFDRENKILKKIIEKEKHEKFITFNLPLRE